MTANKRQEQYGLWLHGPITVPLREALVNSIMPSVEVWRGHGSLSASLPIFQSENESQRKLEMKMVLCCFVTNDQARPQAGYPVILHELQGDKNQWTGCNTPKKRPKLHKTQEHYASVSVPCLYYGDQEVICAETLSAAAGCRLCWDHQNCSSN